MGLFTKNPIRDYIKAQKRIARLSKKRARLKKENKGSNRDEIANCNRKMSVELAKRDAAAMQLQNPASITKKTNLNFTFSKQQDKKSIEFHGHLHVANKKRKFRNPRNKKS